MKKLKQALSLSLALVLSLALALPAASAAGVEDYKYVKFSNEPIGRTQLTFNNNVNTDQTVTSLAWIFPDDTTITMTVPDDGSIMCKFLWGDSFDNFGLDRDTFIEFTDLDMETFEKISLGKTNTFQMDSYGLYMYAIYDSYKVLSEGLYWILYDVDGKLIEEVYFCSQSALDDLVSKGAISVMQPAEQPTTPPQPQQPSVQISDWAKDQVSRATANGLVADGLGNDYRVNITRAQFAATAVKLYEAMSGQTAPAAGNSPFTDTSDPAVIQAQALGFVSGVGNDQFAPDALVTREQAASMLSRVYTKLGGNIPTVTATTFADNGSVSAWARDAVAFMSDKGIVSGTGNNNFTPQGNASIEQALSIALRMFENLK